MYRCDFPPAASLLCLFLLAPAAGCSGDVGNTASGAGGGSAVEQGSGGEDEGSGGDAQGPAGSGGAPSGSTSGSSTSDATTATATAAVTSTGTGSADPFCGDATCDPEETCDSCAGDCGACSGCQGASDATTSLDAEEEAFLGIINAYRADNGLGALTACTSLARAAQGHSEDMRDQDYFDHVSPDGSSFTERACDACYELGCSVGTTMGENLAAGSSTAELVFEQWRTSPGHDQNMRGAGYTQIGIGRAAGGGTYGTYWTNVFAGDTEPSCN